MNILQLCLSPGLGGLELYVYRSALALESDNKVFAVINENGKLRDYFDSSSISHAFLRCRFKKLPLLAAKKLAAYIDDNAIDVIHMHWGNDLPLAALAKYFSQRKPALIYTRQMQLTRSKNDIYHNFLYQQMDVMLTITQALADIAKQKLSPRDCLKVRPLYYGVKAPDKWLNTDEKKVYRAEWQVPEKAFLVGIFGRLEHNKGQYLLIEALAKAKQNGLPLFGLIVGHEMDSGYRQQLVKLCEEKGINERIVFQDFVENPQALMQACDCLALATHEETFGLVLVEAMRAGVAVIGSDRGGVPEIIDHEKTGLLFESGDADSLYEQLQALYQKPEYKESLARAGKEKADTVFEEVRHYVEVRNIFKLACVAVGS